MTTRRSFLASILAAAAAPAIVRSGVIMPVRRPIEVVPADALDQLLDHWVDAMRYSYPPLIKGELGRIDSMVTFVNAAGMAVGFSEIARTTTQRLQPGQWLIVPPDAGKLTLQALLGSDAPAFRSTPTFPTATAPYRRGRREA